MPNYNTWKDLKDLERLKERANQARFLHIYRPVLLHDRKSSAGHVCPCCGSDEAAIVKQIPHIEMLLDVWKGTRKFRTRTNSDAFDKLANGPSVEKIYMPLRCSITQWKFIADMRYCIRRGKFRKVVALFGGNRSGKTTIADELLVDLVLIKGGKSRSFWIVAPTGEKTMVSVEKVCGGTSDAVDLPPLIDPRLVRSYPTSEMQARYKPIRLIDGTAIFAKHAHGNGANLKGWPTQGIFVDEGCEIRDNKNWHVMLNRTMGTKGCLFVSTTPVAGHWLKEEVHDPGVSLAEAKATDLIISDRLSCFDNPWYSAEQVRDTIEALSDPRLIAREVHGEWVPMGNILWGYWDAKSMATKGWRTCEDLGFVNITDRVAKQFFRRHKDEISSFGGLDYNRFPMSLIDIQIGVPEDCEEPEDPTNWHAFACNEVVENGGTQQFCEMLNKGECARLLGLPADYFVGFPIAADATGSQDSIPSGHGELARAASLGEYMKLQGFAVQPCHRSDTSDSPQNPGQLERLNLAHKLMFEGRLHVNQQRCKKLIHAFETQECKPDGRIEKEPGKPTDKLSGPSDALTYGLWAVLSRHEPGFRKATKWSPKTKRAA